jgi:hypothetical protein
MHFQQALQIDESRLIKAVFAEVLFLRVILQQYSAANKQRDFFMRR